MSSLSLLVVGIVLVFLGLTDQLSLLGEAAQPKEGYREIPVGTFVIGTVVVTLPAILLGKYSRQYAWSYVAMIILMFLVTNYEGVENFSDFLNKYI